MSTSAFVEKYFEVTEPVPKGLDDSQVEVIGRVVDVSDLEGQFRLLLHDGKRNISAPAASSIPRGDSYYLYEHRVYRLLIHLKPAKNFPTNIHIHLELCKEAQAALIPLREEVTSDGYLALFVYAIYRIQIAKWYPLCAVLFEKEELNELPREDRDSVPGEAEQEPEGSKRSAKPRSKQGAEQSISISSSSEISQGT